MPMDLLAHLVEFAFGTIFLLLHLPELGPTVGYYIYTDAEKRELKNPQL
jgi:hypothetical protein